ncbi:uncharacterized protein GGS22DRAFT_190918 [Annulohypoxylon maeteangense]|uniref:uncharacterized protein n=1 Tax=Annulohypoxylon maeteangense TaxID=1927788 RepID=UPI0020088CFE|nr:uncharacterized protein GGS22DRAFT_190918 [Annulohypoxylon maeteangense]KAI0882941.1 hypothetical protein GGS22DRAFT_190918 [Annulohypoxylon maeteangense]
MLPTSLEETYNQCKIDTDAFLTWLDDTYRACGYTPQATSTMSSALGRHNTSLPSRRRNNNASRYATSIRKLSAKIDAIIQSPTMIRMPRKVRTKVERAIDGRQTCLEWYDRVDNRTDEFDVCGHRFFIEFLQEALRKFEEIEPMITSIPKPAPKREPVIFENRFAQLGLDDMSET